VTPSRSGSCDSYVAFESCESFLSTLHAGIGGIGGIKVIEGIVGREIGREKTMPDHYCSDCDEATQDCRCHNDICPDSGDVIQEDSEKVACSCTIWEVLPDR
jgi:hypothetical protein